MYEKLSVKTFKDALAEHKYVTATAARRAVGKASTLSDAEKDQCRKAIDAAFNVAEVVKPTAKPVVKAVSPIEAAIDSVVKEVKAPKEKTVAKAKTQKAPKVDQRQLSIFGTTLRDDQRAGSLDDFKNLTIQMKIAEKTIQNTGNALGVLLEAKKICPDSDLVSSIESASAVLSSAVEIFRGVTHKVTSYMVTSAKADLKKETPASVPNGKAIFDESSP